MDELTILHMRQRIAMCRRLARSTTDPEVAVILHQMADDGEADIKRMIESGSVAEIPPAAEPPPAME